MIDKAVWQKFKRDPLAVFGLFFLSLVFILALLAYALAPDRTENANRILLPLALSPPGTSFKIMNELSHQSSWRDMISGAATNESKVLDSVLIKGDTIFGRLMDQEEWISWLKSDSAIQLEKGVFWLGADRFGRDVLSRLLVGARVSFSVGLLAVMISLIIGLFMGLLSGYFGAWVDKLVMWLINVVWSLPTLLLVIAITLAIGKGFWQIFIAVGLTMWVDLARIVRGQVKSLREMEYIQAARVLGFSHLRILLKHILPNIWAPVIVLAAANFASAILLEAGLSFLGLGVQPPAPSWGMMIKEHYTYIVFDAAFLAVFPGMCIMLTVMSVNFVGNGLRNALDVKL